MPADTPSGDALLPTRRSLLSRLRDLSDNTSWQDFFETYWKLIYTSATKAGLSHAEAEEVVQETVLRVTRAIQDFRYDPAIGSFKGWLLNTTRWQILAHLRRRGRTVQAGAGADLTRRTDLLAQIPDPTTVDLDQSWEADWQQTLMDAALRRLRRSVKPKHFQIFDLYALQGWPAARVAAALDVSLAQVHVVKHRLGAQVRKEVRRLQQMGI